MTLPSHGPYRLTGAASPRLLQTVRNASRTWLAARGVEPGAAADVVLAVSELYTNALQAGATEISVEVDCVDGVVSVSVVDDGPGWSGTLVGHALPPDSSERGRGLAIVARLGELRLRRAGDRTHADLLLVPG